MEIEHLREFLVFAKTLNYSTAAKELYIAQPTLSQHISKLSTEVGQPLVSQKGSAHLTQAGNVLSLYAQSITSDYEKMMEAFRAMGATPNATIRIVDVRISLEIGPTLRAIRFSQPEPPFCVEYVGDKALFEKGEFDILDEGLTDISFAIAPNNYLEYFSPELRDVYGFIPLAPLEGRVVLSARHPLAAKEKLTASDMATLNIIVVGTPFWQNSEKSLLAVLERNGITPKTMSGSARSKWEVPACDLNFASITFSDAVRLNPVGTSDEYAIMGFEDFDFTVQPYGIYRKDNENPALPRFLELWEKALTADGKQSPQIPTA